jgi:hypothetical protein
MGLLEFIFEVLGGDLIQRAGRDLRGDNAQFLRLGQNFFVLQVEFLRNVVNANGHICLSLRALFALQHS